MIPPNGPITIHDFKIVKKFDLVHAYILIHSPKEVASDLKILCWVIVFHYLRINVPENQNPENFKK